MQKKVKAPPKFSMKYKGRSESDVYDDDLPQEEKLEKEEIVED